MNTHVQALKERLEQLERRCGQAESRYRHAERRLRVLGGLALAAVVGAILVSPSNRAALAQGYGITLKELVNRVNALEDKTRFLSIGGVPACKEVVFSGVNVRIVNGLGSTDQTNGCGNLIVGYNALRNEGDDRTGSHNIIVGDFNNYSAFGGLVAGNSNTISAPYASISGGESNLASSSFSSVSGGIGNTASGYASSVSGGELNNASGFASSVSGGNFNLQGFLYGWSGGDFHTP